MNNDLREAKLIIEIYKDKICKANARIRELEALLDECEKALAEATLHIGGDGSICDLLAKLRAAQEQVNE